jgi:hypothetical protein
VKAQAFREREILLICAAARCFSLGGGWRASSRFFDRLNHLLPLLFGNKLFSLPVHLTPAL